jgi:hypothetical protein
MPDAGSRHGSRSLSIVSGIMQLWIGSGSIDKGFTSARYRFIATLA